MGRHYDDPLEFLLDSAAESETDGACKDLTPTPKLRAQWAEFEEAVAEAMLAWGDTEDLGDEVSQVIQNEQYAYDVYMTLDGAGVGIWDGRWEPYLPESKIARLESHLKGLRAVGEAFRTMEGYFRDEVWYQCRGRRARGEKLDPTLNGALRGAPDCDDLIALRAAELRELREDFKIVHKRGGGMAIRHADGSLEEPCKPSSPQARRLAESRGLPSWLRPRR